MTLASFTTPTASPTWTTGGSSRSLAPTGPPTRRASVKPTRSTRRSSNETLSLAGPRDPRGPVGGVFRRQDSPSPSPHQSAHSGADLGLPPDRSGRGARRSQQREHRHLHAPAWPGRPETRYRRADREGGRAALRAGHAP